VNNQQIKCILFIHVRMVYSLRNRQLQRVVSAFGDLKTPQFFFSPYRLFCHARMNSSGLNDIGGVQHQYGTGRAALG
jgi:hypothetical protein